MRKVHDPFASARTVHVPFSFGLFIARAIDQLCQRHCVSQIMAGPRPHAPGSTAALRASSKSFPKESHEAISGLLDLTANLSQLNETDVSAQIKDTADSIVAGQKLITEAYSRVGGMKREQGGDETQFVFTRYFSFRNLQTFLTRV